MSKDKDKEGHFTNYMNALERFCIQRALKDANYSATKAAKELGLSYQTFYNKMKKHGLTRKQLAEQMMDYLK